MTMQSEVEFKNKSAEQIKVIPKGKSEKRWEQFTIYPYGGYTVKDSISGGRDIQFSVYARPKGGRVDELIGEFMVDNPPLSAAHTWNYSPRYTYKAFQGSYAYKGQTQTYNTKYYGGRTSDGYYDYFPDQKGIVGKVDPKKFDHEGQNSYLKGLPSGDMPLYTLDTNAAFDKSLPYIEHSFLGEGYGTKAWQFTFKDWA